MISNIQNVDFPSQRVSDKEKEKYEWYSACCDFIIAQGESYKDTAETELKYNVLHGRIPEEFYRKTINPYTQQYFDCLEKVFVLLHTTLRASLSCKHCIIP